MRIAINGFGRIGRLTFRQLINRDDVTIVAINDLTDDATLAHLLKYDTAHGPFKGTVTEGDHELIVNGHHIKSYAQPDPAQLPWGELDIDVVLDCTGRFLDRKGASKHLEAGAKHVLLSAPAKDKDIQTLVLGVNEDEIDRTDPIYSNASCTTNCLTPVLKIIDENYGIRSGFMTTIHAYTSTQNIQDGPQKDLRRARAAAQNIVPTSTGAAKAAALVYPKIGNKISAMSMRVPIITGSIIELHAVVDRPPASASDVNAVFKAQAEGPLRGILQYTEDPIVSSDVIGNTNSSIFDALLTEVHDGMIKVVSWYDNEAGYSARLAQMAVYIAQG